MIAGIDIGTSYSSLCILGTDKKAVPVDISTGTGMYGSKYSLPSAVFVEENGRILVGQAAMNSRKRAPQNFCMEFKRNFGQEIPVILGNRHFLPRELYTEVFRHMAECVVKNYGEKIDKAFITYPASFSKTKKEQIIAAARAAGLFDVVLMEEPVAAAMCYRGEGYIKDGQTALIYDFGGGTFDVSILKYENHQFTLLGEADGLEHCGGIDLDRLIYEDMFHHIDPELLAQASINPMNRLRLEEQIAELAVKAKHHLSSAESFAEDMQIGFDLVPYGLTRERFDSLAAPLISQTISVCRRAMENAQVKPEDLSAILLVGGTSRIPLVRNMIEPLTQNGKVTVLSAVDLELAVAKGALEIEKAGIQAVPQNMEVQEHVNVQNRTELQEEEAYNRVQLFVSEDEAVGLTADGRVVVDHIRDNETADRVKGWEDVVSLRCGIDNAHIKLIVGLKKDGRVVVAGPNRRCVVPANCWENVSAVYCDVTNVFGLSKDGRVAAVGDNENGQCNVAGWQNVADIKLGSGHTVGLSKDGRVVAVGNNDRGQCDVGHWRNVKEILCGGWHTVGLLDDGRVVATGDNIYGRCDVEHWRDVVSVIAGWRYTAGLCKDGRAVIACNKMPGRQNIEGLNNVVRLAGDKRKPYIAAFLKDGRVAVAGVDEAVAQEVSGWQDVKDVIFKDGYVFGLLKSGRVVAAGEDEDFKNYGYCAVRAWEGIVRIFSEYGVIAGVRKDGTVIRNSYKSIERIVKSHIWKANETELVYVPDSPKVLPWKLF